MHPIAIVPVSPTPSPPPSRGSSPGSLLAIVVFFALAATALYQFRRARRAVDPTWYDPTANPDDDPDLKH